MTYRIMTFDGGGIGGLFTAAVLERLLEIDAFPALIDQTNLFAGTSTGGIIALGLAHGLAPGQLAALYRDHAKDIFDDSAWDDFTDLGNAIGADYATKPLKRLLTQVFGASSTLRSLGDRRVLVPTFDLHSPPDPAKGRPDWMWKPKFFHNYPGEGGESNDDLDEPIVDIALRTSAAPTYFPSYQGYIDGGVVANNPSMCALAQALHTNTGGQSLDDCRVLSFGTGYDAKHIDGDTLDWGWGQWARPLVSLMIGGVAGVADYQCRQLLGEKYLRVDRLFDRPVNLDDKRPETLRYLIEQAREVPIEPIVEWLQANWA